MTKNSKSPDLVSVLVGAPVLRDSDYGNEQFIEIQQTVEVDFESDLDWIITKLAELKQTYGNTYSNLHFQSARDCGCRYDCSCLPTYHLNGLRPETELERQHREESSIKLENEKNERERREFERLAKKFG